MIYFTFPNCCLTWLFSVVLLSFAALFPANAQPFQYVWSNEATMDVYSPDPAYVRNGGAPIKIRQYDTGKYQVFFGRVLSEPGGYSVTKYGAGPGYCSLGLENMVFEDDIAQTIMEVYCFDGLGAPAPSQFSLLRASGSRYGGQKLAYGLIIPSAGLTGETAALWRAEAHRTYPGPMPVDVTPSVSLNGEAIGDGYNYEVKPGRSHVIPRPAASLVSSFASQGHCSGGFSGGFDDFRFHRIPCNRSSNGGSLQVVYFMVVGKDVGYNSKVNASVARNGFSLRGSYNTDDSEQSMVAMVETLSGRHIVGRHIVTLGPEASAGGNVQVSASSPIGVCNVDEWGGGQVNVSCWRGAEPAADMGFTVLAIKVPDILTPQFPVDLDLGEPIAPGVDRDRIRERPFRERP